MIKNGLYFLVVLFSFCACRDMTEHNAALIVGTWEAVDKNNMATYRFDNNEICSMEPGFLEYVDATKPTVLNPEISRNGADIDIPAILHNTIRFYRKGSCYKIEKQFLKIYDPALKAWNENHIRFISQDTLELSNKKKEKVEYYARKENRKLPSEPLFDQILVYFPSTVLESRKYYSFYRNGQMICYGNNGFPANCTFATIKEEDFVLLENYFKQASIQKYMERLNGSHLNTYSPDYPSIIFVKGNESYSFNNDFHLIADSDYRSFYTAYFTALYYAVNISYQPRTEFVYDELLYDFAEFRLWRLYVGGKEIALTELEYYYLILLLRASPETNKTFHATYLFKDKDSNAIKMRTDGQYFRFRSLGGERTIDIGFNFIEKNIIINNL